jgi:hypothetical protein
MNRMHIDFAMARHDREDLVLRAIAEEALDFLLEHVDVDTIRCVLLTGSVANGEGTVIRDGSSMVTSDFDFVIYMGFFDFLRKRAHLQNLSKQITTRLGKRGINTHITLLPSTSILQKNVSFPNAKIYEYEFAFASKCLFGKSLSFDRTVRPSKKDALELTFTVVSDLVFSNLKNFTKIEESYIYAKRALTLLNSALIFNGVFAKTYEKRMKIAKEYASKGAIPLNQDEIKVLEIFTEYKLSGSFQHLLDSFGCKDVDDLIKFQREFLKRMTTKILYYGLMVLVGKPMKINFKYSNSLQNMISEFPELLREYSKNSKARSLSRIIGIIICVFGLFARDRERKELFTAFIFHKQPPKVILNVLATLLLVGGGNVSAMRILREIFPWIDFSDVLAIQKMFALWQVAEQSVKLS